MKDLSDRELERYIGDSTAAKWFCDFALTKSTLIIRYLARLEQKSELLSYQEYLVFSEII